jgi:hypothetical protein
MRSALGYFQDFRDNVPYRHFPSFLLRGGMASTTAIPVTVTQEASDYVGHLGVRPMLERMLVRARQVVPKLQAIEVSLASPSDPGEDPRLLVVAIMERPDAGYDPTQKMLGLWMVETFPPDVCRHFCLLTAYGDADADER